MMMRKAARQKTAGDSALVATLVRQLGARADEKVPFDAFLREVDEINQRAMPELAKLYGSERQAKALLLKLSNVAVGKYQYLRRHTRLVARPYGIIIDPCNSCPLECPGCIQREKGVPKNNIDWVPGNLKQPTLDRFLEELGPYAVNTQFYNWGEPLLNKHTPKYISDARRFFTRTSVSTNLSVPFDAEALVASGLDYLVMSIDGATQGTYEKYRIGGDLELVLSNIEALVKARKKLKSATPFMVWQYLLFDHTLAEVEMAEKMAGKLGVDRINFAAPYDVSANDPTITITGVPPVRHRVFNQPVGAMQASASAAVANLHPRIDEAWEQSWLAQMDGEYEDRPGASTCQWLYKDTIMDATGRIMPCCFDPMKTPTSVFGHVREKGALFNHKHYVNSREYFASKETAEPGTACKGCPYKTSTPNINKNHLAPYFMFADTQAVLGDAAGALCDWHD